MRYAPAPVDPSTDLYHFPGRNMENSVATFLPLKQEGRVRRVVLPRNVRSGWGIRRRYTIQGTWFVKVFWALGASIFNNH